MARRIIEKVPEKQLFEDLEKYQKKALALGAADAKIITTNDIIFDERVRMKCLYPKCYFYGISGQCPPNSLPIDEYRKAVVKYNYAIFFTLEVPPKDFIGTEVMEKELYLPHEQKHYDVVSLIEADAFYDGYYLALGFAAGPCKLIFCLNADCNVLQGKPCRAAGRARTSMEGAGMDVFMMSTKMGWEIYPCGFNQKPEDVPIARLGGLILIY